ncbi:MAG: VWA domain-containing protein [Lysobacterales bacterium]
MRIMAIAWLILLTPLTHATTYQKVDVCFVLDTTGSMSAAIQTAKEKVWFIANEIARAGNQPDLRLCLMAYRDRGDDYVTRLSELTDNIDDIHADLKALEAGGGGDTPEAVHQALAETVKSAGWDNAVDTLKVIFLIGDAPPNYYPDEPQYPEIAALASAANIVINPVLIGGDQDARLSFQAIEKNGTGSLLELADAHAQAAPTTPMDQDLIALSSRLNASLVLYGNPEQQSRLDQLTSELESLSDSQQIERLAFGQASGRLLHEQGDLVQDLEAGSASLEDIEPGSLPEKMRSMNQQELSQSLGEIRAERLQLQTLIGELLSQRRMLIEGQVERSSFEYQLSQVLLRQL